MNTRSTSGKVAVNVPKLFHLCSVVVRGQWSVTYKVTRAGGECGLPVCFVDLIGSAKRTRTCMCSVGPYAIIVRARKWLSLNSNKLAVTIYVVLILIGRLSELSGHKLRFVCPLHLATKPNEPSGIGTAPYYSMCNLLYEPISYWMTCCSPTHSPLTTLRKLAQIECCKNNNCYYYSVSNISRVHTSCNQMEPLRASDQKKHEEICFEEIREISVLGYCDKFNTEHNMCQLDTPVILLGCDKFWNMISSSFSSHYISRSDSGSHH